MENLSQLQAAKFYLLSTLGISNFGYSTEEQIFEVDGQELSNVVAEIRGTSKADEIVLVVARYDSPTGATDDPSGIAALLSLADAFAKKPQLRTIRFIAFPRQPVGRNEYAKKLAADGDNVVGILALQPNENETESWEQQVHLLPGREALLLSVESAKDLVLKLANVQAEISKK